MKNIFLYFLFGMVLIVLTACGHVPRAVKNFPVDFLQGIASQSPSVGVRHERPLIDADTKSWVLGTIFYRGLGNQVFMLDTPVKIPAGYSGYPVYRDPILTIPSNPGWYCVIYSPHFSGGETCLSRAIKEDDTVHLLAGECRQTCDR